MIKRNFMARITVIMLCLSFVLATPVDMIADEYETDKTVNVITPDAFQELFTGNSRNVKNISVDSVRYMYNFQNQDETNIASVVMNAVFTISGIDYVVELTGTVTGHILEDDEMFWEGPIEGSIKIEETEYLVIASFAKLGTLSNNVQVCATIQTLDNNKAISPVVVQFGEDIITSEIYNQVYLDNKTSKNVDSENQEDTVMQQTRAAEFSFYDYEGVYFNGVIMDGLSQYLRAYYSPNTWRVAGGIKVYPDNVNEYFDKLGTAVTGVHSFTVSLKRESYTTSSYSWIDGIELFDFEEDNFGKSNIDLKPLFDDALSLIGYSSSTIDALLEDLSGKVTRTSGSSSSSVTVQGLSDDTICEDYILPIVFQMDRTISSQYTGNSEYTMTSSVKYISIYLPLFSEVYSISYTDSGTAEIPMTISLNESR